MLAEFESRILALIDEMVDHASDDELFASGYLRGHLTLAVAELEGGDDHSAKAINDRVIRSLEKAIGAGELSPPDQILVQGMWNNLYQGQSNNPLTAWPEKQARSRDAGYRPDVGAAFCPNRRRSPPFGLFHRFSLQQLPHP
ncbi:YfcL protein [Raoultella ornithinolytica]|nr:YfcL protein [Raoultella ornithinolytica]